MSLGVCVFGMPMKTGIQESLKEAGLRFALAIASLPGMTMHFVVL